jgi:uncharacterized damage-inducible protein DinB
MNATELLCYLTDKQLDTLFETAKKLPADKLNWQPTEGSRSALSQLQEVATALGVFLPGIKARKVEWDDSNFASWMEQRAKLTTLDELEKTARAQTKELTDYIRTLPEAELSEKVDMPFPGEYKVADVLAYHYWNMSYHEGQIVYLTFMLEGQAK